MKSMLLGSQPLRILFLEDEIILALTFVETIKDLSLGTVIQAADIAEAEEALAGGDIDIAVLDVNLDGMSSLGVARKIAANGGAIIFATGYSDDPDLFEEFDCSVLRKPYEASDLARAVQNAASAIQA